MYKATNFILITCKEKAEEDVCWLQSKEEEYKKHTNQRKARERRSFKFFKKRIRPGINDQALCQN